MKPGDVGIWEKFISEFPDMYDTVQYDFDVGSAPEFDTVVNNATGGDASLLYRRKIDVVGFKEDQIDIIEIKPSAGPSALGQVLSYVELYVRDEKPPVQPKAIVLTDVLLIDMGHLASQLGVQIVVV